MSTRLKASRQTARQIVDQQALAEYRSQAPWAERAHPTDEHLMPLQVAYGATTETEPFEVLETEVRFGMLSMESYAWGLARQA
ncbi:MAG: hypothetical protein ACK5SV_03135 [Burkholderiales bacterium]|jgi:4,5-DOPA dioxygenase extradiol